MQFKDLLKRHSDVERDASEPAEKPQPGKSVVVAEKERATRDVVAAEVRNLGYLPLLTEDGNRAFAMAREHQPRLVIANLELDGAGGADVLSRLREDAATRDIAVVLISNTSEPPDVVAGTQLGADDYLCKPVEGVQVKTRLRELLLRDSREVLPVPHGATPSGGPAGHIGRADELYAQCVDFAKDVADRAGRNETPDIERCRDLAVRLVRECAHSNRLLLRAIRPYEPGEKTHDAPNVAVFSINIGRGLGYDAEELTALAMAALCHEVGMARVPGEVLAAEGKYTRRELAELQKHPEYAREMLSRLGDQYAWLTQAVTQAHEREGGQGYPQGLRGEQICEFAKIIGLADTYESLSHPRTFRRAFIAFDALREIIGMRNKFFAAHVIRALVSEVSVFPLDSYVELNTGETGRVARTSADNLLRPVVVVECDASGQRLKRPKMIDLASRPLLYVTKPVDERDLPKRT